MAKLILEGMTLEQAIELAHYYEGQGESNANTWMEEQGLEAPLVDVGHKPKWLEINEDSEVVTVYCK